MDADKNHGILEKQLKTLGQKTRIDILKTLNTNSHPIVFSSLQKEIFDDNPNSKNFSFHLKALKKMKLISSTTNGWTLTSLGKKIIKHILSIEQIIDEQEKTLMIRTSKYSKEPFNIQKIETYLVMEGGMEIVDARSIAKEVKKRLFKTSIEYLTAPLMREYINGILLEKGFEHVRHELTRLGTPPHEVKRLLALNQYDNTPETILAQIGSDVSEQFLLLNLLPNHLADSYLSGEVALLHLDNWWLRPISLYLDSKTLLDLFDQNTLALVRQKNNNLALISLLTSFFETLVQISPFFSQDLLIGNFNTRFISLFNSLDVDKKSFFFNILARQINLLNNRRGIDQSRLALDFSSQKQEEAGHVSSESIEKLLNQLNSQCHSKPLIAYDYSNLDLNLIPTMVKDNIIFYNGQSSSLINSLIVNVENLSLHQENAIILDKILINFHSIATQASQNDSRFFDMIQEKLDLVFDLFRCKGEFMKKHLGSNKEWNSLINNYFKWKSNEWINEAIKSVSFFGLNEAIEYHCGIEMDRNDKSEAFALDVLNLIKDIIEEKNDSEGEKFILGQPHQGNYLKIPKKDVKPIDYSARIVRAASRLKLDQKIKIFKKFESILQGGVLFNYDTSSTEDILETLKILLDSRLSAFSINGNLI